MQYVNIENTQGNGFYFVAQEGDFDYVNPIQKISEMLINSNIQFQRNSLLFAPVMQLIPIIGIEKGNTIIERIVQKNAFDMWRKEYENIMSQQLPLALFNILEGSSKKEQIRILKGISLSGDQLLSFIFKAHLDHKYTYSVYSSEHQHNGLDENQMPFFAYKKDDDAIISIGKTTLTDGEIKQAIINRHVTVAKFLDRGDIWHCFFLTFKSILGKERGWQGQPHIHYISSNWGLTRETVLTQLKSKNYCLPSSLPHINWISNR